MAQDLRHRMLAGLEQPADDCPEKESEGHTVGDCTDQEVLVVVEQAQLEERQPIGRQAETRSPRKFYRWQCELVKFAATLVHRLDGGIVTGQLYIREGAALFFAAYQDASVGQVANIVVKLKRVPEGNTVGILHHVGDIVRTLRDEDMAGNRHADSAVVRPFLQLLHPPSGGHYQD